MRWLDVNARQRRFTADHNKLVWRRSRRIAISILAVWLLKLLSEGLISFSGSQMSWSSEDLEDSLQPVTFIDADYKAVSLCRSLLHGWILEVLLVPSCFYKVQTGAVDERTSLQQLSLHSDSVYFNLGPIFWVLADNCVNWSSTLCVVSQWR